MDDLEFRRRAYTDPHSKDDDFQRACHGSQEKQELVDNLKSLDNKLKQALAVDPPADLSAKLLDLPNTPDAEAGSKRQSRSRVYYLGIAASLVIAAVVHFSILRYGPINLGEHALEHVRHEPSVLLVKHDIGLSQINSQLAKISSNLDKFTKQPGEINFSSICDFQGVLSLHMVMNTGKAKVSVFVIPHDDRMTLNNQFADNSNKGIGFSVGKAYLLLVSNNGKSLTQAKREIEQSFI